MPHYLQFDLNTMNLSRIRRCMIETEEILSKNAEEKESSVEILQGCENSQPANFVGCEFSQVVNFSQVAKFRNLRILAGCEISQHAHLCQLTAF